MRREILVFLAVSALVGLAAGMSDSLMANYFKEAYDTNAQQRGFIEFPRELPGVLSIFAIAALAALGNIKSAIVAQFLAAAGLVALGFYRPSFAGMLVFLFIYSLGQHMYIPLGDSIGLSLAKQQNAGFLLGRFNSLRMAALMVAGIVTFFGFRIGWFSFETPVTVFLIAAVLYLFAACLIAVLRRQIPERRDDGTSEPARVRFVWRKEYVRYYLICALFGGRKQIMFVYSPWVLIELLNFRADSMSLLAIIGALIGIFFMPVVGRLIDRYGVRRVMIVEALAFIFIYIGYGSLSRWVNMQPGHVVVLAGLAMLLVYLLNVVDRMSAQFAMVRAIYMRQIALVPEDVTPSLTLGMAIDHVVSIGGSAVCGVIWYNWGPEYVFVVAGVMSLLNLIVALGIRTADTAAAAPVAVDSAADADATAETRSGSGPTPTKKS
jgi:predicted MFS family arabinose efflux permease